MPHARTLATSTRTAHYPKGPRIVVKISREVIDRGEIQDSSKCMIAEALKEAVPGAKAVSVDLQTIRYTDPERPFRYTYLTPRSAQIGLLQFDAGEHVEPYNFTLYGAHVTKARVGRPSRSFTTPLPEKATIVTGGSDTSLPRKVGGPTPPLADLVSPRKGHVNTSALKRRQFGLRGMER